MDRKTALEKLRERFEAEKQMLTQRFTEQLELHLDALVAAVYGAIGTMDSPDSVRIIQIQVMRTDVF